MAPFGKGSVSLGLHRSAGSDATEQAGAMLVHAVAAEEAGFDGVTISEHHAGFPGYMPQPVLLAAAILARTSTVWSGPCPVLLNLRNPVLLAEELAWLDACFPGRVGAALAPGYAEQDFVATGNDHTTRLADFARLIDDLLVAMRPNGPIGRDPAIASLASRPLPLLSAANSEKRLAAAARRRLGIVFPGGENPDRLARLAAHYRNAGGTGPVVWIKSVWIGAPPATEARSESAFRAAAAEGMRQRAGFADGQLSGSPAQVCDGLIAGAATIGATSINLRIHPADASLAEVTDQIGMVGSQVLPTVRCALPS